MRLLSRLLLVLAFSLVAVAFPSMPAQAECVGLIIKGGNHLLTLINDILDLAKIESGKIEMVFEYISPIELVNECLPMVTELSRKYAVELVIPSECKDDIMVRADYVRLKQVFLNLLTNGIKYNKENGTVTFRVEKSENHTVRIYVTDSGIGISVVEQGNLFKPFSRIGGDSSEIEGTGIGLVVCKNLMALMHGSISVTSELGKGTEVCIELPQINMDDDYGES